MFFLTVDWCNQGKRGIFCDENGHAFAQDTEHTEDDIWGILDVFGLVLSPKSMEFTEDELKAYNRWYPLAEFSNKYGVAIGVK